MQIRSANFVISNTDVAKCPKNNLPEYAFIGRSNVGKSSLINALCNTKKLAKTSSRPGKTQLINHFLINNHWYLVDLPGYGYARVSKTQKKIFQKFITNYLKERKQLINAFVLVDIRHEPQNVDLEFMEWLGKNHIPFSIVFTKSDKIKPEVIKRNVEAYETTLLEGLWEEAPPIFVTSSSKKSGCEQLLGYIHSLNEEFLKFNTI